MSEHEHGPPSVSAGGVKRVLWVLYAVVAIFIAIDVVWFGPDWVSNLGQETHHEEPGEASHEEPAASEEHWPDAQAEEPHPVGHMANPKTEEHGFGGHKHGHYAFEKLPIFHALYGFAGCVLLVLAARVLRMVVMRDEDYYGDDAPLDEEQTEEGHA
jgi:hypothetical protein